MGKGRTIREDQSSRPRPAAGSGRESASQAEMKEPGRWYPRGETYAREPDPVNEHLVLTEESKRGCVGPAEFIMCRKDGGND